MPMKPPTFRSPGQPSRAQVERAYEGRRNAEQPWRSWYKTARWQGIRARQLAEQPLCVMCEAAGIVAPATVCDHVVRHRGDPALFWSGPFQSLCTNHHSSAKQRSER